MTEEAKQFIRAILKTRLLQLEEEMQGFVRWQNDLTTDQQSIDQGRERLARETTAIKSFMEEQGL